MQFKLLSIKYMAKMCLVKMLEFCLCTALLNKSSGSLLQTGN